ncbi:uncharacterized protein LOC134288209 [Aedes albopictus]|uniref:Uncharacterized protein n=1 Tax=Aedes albopictus TaxID=7160 RepID=A0ABM1XKM5_AEDAL
MKIHDPAPTDRSKSVRREVGTCPAHPRAAVKLHKMSWKLDCNFSYWMIPPHQCTNFGGKYLSINTLEQFNRSPTKPPCPANKITIIDLSIIIKLENNFVRFHPKPISNPFLADGRADGRTTARSFIGKSNTALPAISSHIIIPRCDVRCCLPVEQRASGGSKQTTYYSSDIRNSLP